MIFSILRSLVWMRGAATITVLKNTFYLMVFSVDCVSGKYIYKTLSTLTHSVGILNVFWTSVESEQRGSARLVKNKTISQTHTHRWIFSFSLAEVLICSSTLIVVPCALSRLLWCTMFPSTPKNHTCSSSPYLLCCISSLFVVSPSSCSSSSHRLFLFVQTLSLHDLLKPLLWSDSYFWHLSCLGFSFACLPEFHFVLFCTGGSLYPLQRAWFTSVQWLVCRVCAALLMHPLVISTIDPT